MQEWLDNNDIIMYSTHNEGKSVTWRLPPPLHKGNWIEGGTGFLNSTKSEGN